MESTVGCSPDMPITYFGSYTDLSFLKLSCNGSLFLYKQVNFVVKFGILFLHCI